MKKGIQYALILPLISAVFILFLIFHPDETVRSSQKQLISVEVSPVIQRDAQVTLDAIGTIEAYATINVKALVDGQLESVGFKEGDIVEEGQVLFKIDPRPFQVSLQQAEANLAKDEAQLQNALKIAERAGALKKENNFSQQDYDQLLTNAKVLQGAIKVDQAAVAAAKLQLAYCTIRAPVSGYTGSLMFNVGNVIQAKDPNPLVIIKQIVPIYTAFSVPEKYLRHIKKNMDKGLKEIIIYTNGKNRSFTGQLSFINNTVDSNTGNIQLKATFENQDKKLWPGQFVKVKLPLKSLAQALIIPSRAIQAGLNGFYVYVVDQNNKAHIRNIKEGPIINDETVVLEGLQAGEYVVTEGQLKLKEGTQVSISKEPSPLEKQ